ncbi:MAG: S8 family serine peptidase [Pelagimonas sp.]|jgi:subtilisin family serine protease/uncharacterized protein with beta-barrel porin domain|nr:S8 family serine peptidase [Pelagimonas sp.]
MFGQTVAPAKSEQAQHIPLHTALSDAARHGPTSLIASVIENTRLTPWRKNQVLETAVSLRPFLAPKLARASDTGVRLAMPPALPPGAVVNADLQSLTEEQRNFGYNMIGAEAAHRQGLTGKGVVVGVIDSGIARREDEDVHPEFEGRIDPRSESFQHWVNKELTESDFRGLKPEDAAKLIFDRDNIEWWEDVDGHGTHVSGIIAAARDGRGMVGVAPGATILSIGAILSGDQIPGADPGQVYADLQECGMVILTGNCDRLYDSEGETIEGSTAAIKKITGYSDVRIVNGSFGPRPEVGATTYDISDELEEAYAIRDFVRSGKIFVAAAGNEFTHAPIQSENPTGIGALPIISAANKDARLSNGDLVFTGQGKNDFGDLTPTALAAEEKATGKALGRVVVVVAVDARKEIASYSNRCGLAAQWCIAAPGGDSRWDPKTDTVEQREILSTYPDNLGSDETTLGDEQYQYAGGTSMAAPHVSGALAILMEAYPNMTPGQLTQLMFSTAEDLGVAGVDRIYGHGLLRLDRALAGPTGQPKDPNAVYVFNASGTRNFAFSFQRQGGFKKTGEGTLNIEKDTTARFGSTARINKGKVNVSGTLDAPEVKVNQGGTLQGTGRVNGKTTVSGDLSPGASPGTLTFANQLTLTGTANTTIEVDGTGTGTGAGSFDRLIVNGQGVAFTAGGTLTPMLRGISGAATNAFTPVLGQSFAFVTTPNGTVSGAFATVTQPTSGLPVSTRFDLLYDTQQIRLVTTPLSYGNLAANGITTDAAGTAFGAALDTIRPAAGPRLTGSTEVFDTLYRSAPTALADLLSSGAGTIHVDTGQEALAGVRRMSQLMRTTQNTPGKPWFLPLAGRSKVEDGTEGYQSSFGGLAFGANMDIEQSRLAGANLSLAGSYSKARVNDRFGDANVEMAQLAFRFDTQMAQLDVGVTAGVALGKIDTDRNTIGGKASSKSSLRGNFAAIDASYTYQLGSTALKPQVTLGWNSVQTLASAETGASALTLSKNTYDETYAELGLSTNTAFGASGSDLSLTSSVFYRRTFNSVDTTAQHAIQGAQFTAQGANLGRDALRASLGLRAALSETSNLGLEVSFNKSDKALSREVNLGLQVKF